MSTVKGPGADGGASVVLEGRITAYTAAPIWRSAIDTLARNPDRPVVVDASRLEYVDDVGIAFLFDLIRRDRPAHAQVEIRALAPNLAALVRGYDPKDFAAPARGRRPIGILEHVGRATAEQIAYLRQMGRFLGACAAAFAARARGARHGPLERRARRRHRGGRERRADRPAGRLPDGGDHRLRDRARGAASSAR